MKHAALTDEIVERAALYALGALTQIEAQAFEDHLADGCAVCRRELDEYHFAVEGLALATADVEPSPEVRSRLLASLGGGILELLLSLVIAFFLYRDGGTAGPGRAATAHCSPPLPARLSTPR